MANFLNGDKNRELLYGKLVMKPATALPLNATSALYTVSTGNVLVTSMYGVMSTATSTATAATLALGVITSANTATTSIASGSTVSSKSAGTFVSPNPASGVAGALLVSANGATTNYVTNPFIAPVGTIVQTTNANVTGPINWYLTYVPLDHGAYVS